MLLRVRGRSMVPTLYPGDLLWAVPVKKTELARGQLVLLELPSKGAFIKRIVGLPGERVELRSNGLIIDGRPLDEPYVPSASSIQPQADGAWTLAPGSCFVAGDARDDSLDSRRLGPIPLEQIIARVKIRLWPWTRRALVALAFVLFAGRAPARAQNLGGAKLIAFADRKYLSFMIGKYDPKKGWVAASDFYQPPEPQDPFTIYGTAGKLAEVVITDNRKAWPDGNNFDWFAPISEWNQDIQPQALAVSGQGGEPPRVPHALALDDPQAVAVATDYLRGKGVRLEHNPYVTQAFSIDLNGDGVIETLVCAHSNRLDLKDDAAANVYAMALLSFRRKDGRQKMIPLIAHAHYKPATRTVAEDRTYYGTREYYRFLAFVDPAGDGRLAIFVYEAQNDANIVEVFTFDGSRVKKVISTYQLWGK